MTSHSHLRIGVPEHSMPEPFHGESASPENAVRPWRVLHACESVQNVVPIAELQRTHGMRPLLVLPDGPIPIERLLESTPPVRTSLLTAWHQVRHWRKTLLETDPACDSEIVHAHSFPAGMAAVRNCPAVVYHISRFIEDLAREQEVRTPAESATWLSRSFRVAEQFVLARAAAVVVPWNSVRTGVIERGADESNIFVIPPPFEFADNWPPFPVQRTDASVVVCVPLGGVASEALPTLFHALVAAAAEVPQLAFSITGLANPESGPLRELLAISGLGPRLRVVAASDGSDAIAAADIVISMDAGDDSRSVMTGALSRCRALIAADVPANRDITPEGRGCLWYKPDDAADLARKIQFLVRNPGLRLALGQSGLRHLEQTRSAAALVVSYDRLYRHAFARRRTTNLQTPGAQLWPITAS